MARLRSPDGCPWDRAQSLKSLRHYLIEEAYEVLEAMESGDSSEHCEELGDLLLQIVFQSQIRSEAGEFALVDVIESIADKMERRHPHVFGDESAADIGAVETRWEEIKRAEGKGGLEAISASLPALMQAEKVGKKAAKSGFDWQDVSGPLEKVEEELLELREAIATGDQAAIEGELGDLLFASVNAARHVGVRPELALLGTVARFKERYAAVSRLCAAQGRSIEQCSAAELDRLWEEAKRGCVHRQAE